MRNQEILHKFNADNLIGSFIFNLCIKTKQDLDRFNDNNIEFLTECVRKQEQKAVYNCSLFLIQSFAVFLNVERDNDQFLSDIIEDIEPIIDYGHQIEQEVVVCNNTKLKVKINLNTESHMLYDDYTTIIKSIYLNDKQIVSFHINDYIVKHKLFVENNDLFKCISNSINNQINFESINDLPFSNEIRKIKSFIMTLKQFNQIKNNSDQIFDLIKISNVK